MKEEMKPTKGKWLRHGARNDDGTNNGSVYVEPYRGHAYCVRENPDSILELFPDGCPSCGSMNLEALTWESRGSDAITIGCWDCEWMIEPADEIPSCSDELKEWTRKKLAEVKGRVIKAGDHVRFAGSVWEVAEIKQFPHGLMIGIYDEPPGKHVDYLNPGSVALVSRNRLPTATQPPPKPARPCQC